jgi:AraC-like DNA-binding protein
MSSIIVLLASLQGWLLSLGLIFNRTKSYLSNVFLSVIIIVISLELLYYWASISGYQSQDTFPIWIFISYLTLPPALWLYLKANTVIQFHLKKVDLLLFLPALVQIALLFSSRIMPGNGYFHALLVNSITLSDSWFFCTEVVPIIWTAFVVGFYISKVLVMGREMDHLHNPAMKLQLRKIKALLGFFSIVVVLWTMLVVINAPILKMVEGSLVVFIFALAYTAYFKPDFFEIPKSVADKNLFINYRDNAEWKRLCDLFEKEAIYCRCRLTVNELALELKLPSRYVSYLINTYASCSFNDFVNTYRVNEVIKRIKDPAEKHKTLVGIAMETGFNSKSAFNQVFRQRTGQVPSDYLA